MYHLLSVCHPISLEPLLPRLSCVLVIGVSNRNPFFLPHMAVFIKDVEKAKCKEVGRNKEGAGDQSIFGCQLLGQVNIKADEKKKA